MSLTKICAIPLLPSGDKPANASDIGLVLIKLSGFNNKLAGVEKNLAAKLKEQSAKIDRV